MPAYFLLHRGREGRICHSGAKTRDRRKTRRQKSPRNWGRVAKPRRYDMVVLERRSPLPSSRRRRSRCRPAGGGGAHCQSPEGGGATASRQRTEEPLPYARGGGARCHPLGGEAAADVCREVEELVAIRQEARSSVIGRRHGGPLPSWPRTEWRRGWWPECFFLSLSSFSFSVSPPLLFPSPSPRLSQVGKTCRQKDARKGNTSPPGREGSTSRRRFPPASIRQWRSVMRRRAWPGREGARPALNQLNQLGEG
ncbi:uncharacterized protein LOC127422540 [Myxocyprinus asiaticus]|uniref:uncharacterized protein LOC127422540 n=1 Tax=Myxocyprinus asiaticus TaxID=70543 RepID=UPI0022227809|nr:uncharacterized protein LOC127422540 [Myxocyprinus asiaticus]